MNSINAQLYFRQISNVLGLNGFEAEKWLDNNSHKLSGKATTEEEAIREIGKAAKVKIYTVKTVYKSRESVYVGSFDYLTKLFNYTLEIGNSWNKKINTKPSTIKGLVKNLQMSFEEKEGACFDRTSVELV